MDMQDMECWSLLIARTPKTMDTTGFEAHHPALMRFLQILSDEDLEAAMRAVEQATERADSAKHDAFDRACNLMGSCNLSDEDLAAMAELGLYDPEDGDPRSEPDPMGDDLWTLHGVLSERYDLLSRLKDAIRMEMRGRGDDAMDMRWYAEWYPHHEEWAVRQRQAEEVRAEEERARRAESAHTGAWFD